MTEGAKTLLLRILKYRLLLLLNKRYEYIERHLVSREPLFRFPTTNPLVNLFYENMVCWQLEELKWRKNRT